jgi:2-(1,2-epoxy-1,2-dihydrophenyl)acetyl-CoA isomerase
MMRYSTLTFDVENNVATICLNRKEAANAMNLEMANELMHAAITCSELSKVRAVIVTGADHVFSVGGDLIVFHTTRHRSSEWCGRWGRNEFSHCL